MSESMTVSLPPPMCKYEYERLKVKLIKKYLFTELSKH